VEATRDLNKFDTVVVLRLRNMTALDATRLHAIEQFANRLHKSGRTLLLCGAREQPARLLAQADFIDHVGRENILPHVQAALERARQINAEFRGLGLELATDVQHWPL
jgi:SulP family sulfate permease